MMYGAQPKKLAKMLGCSLEKAQGLYNAFWDSNPALKQLKENLVKYWKATNKEYILGVDGRKIYTRSEHSLVNALFQSCGAILMEMSGNIMYDWLREEDLLSKGVQRAIFMHN